MIFFNKLSIHLTPVVGPVSNLMCICRRNVSPYCRSVIGVSLRLLVLFVPSCVPASTPMPVCVLLLSTVVLNLYITFLQRTGTSKSRHP